MDLTARIQELQKAFTKAELYEQADRLDIEGRSQMSKFGLAEAIADHESLEVVLAPAEIPVVTDPVPSVPPPTPWRGVRTDLLGNIIPNPFTN